LFEYRLLAKAAEAIAKHQAEMGNAALIQPAPDYAAYRQRVGEFHGLQTALDIIATIQKENT
jgi:hypothetical protein